MTERPSETHRAETHLTETRLADGRRLVVRPARPDDTDAVVRLYTSLSLDDRYRRFFSGFHPRRAFVAQWISAAERGGCSLVAEVVADDRPVEIVGEAGYALVADGGAEFAITVAHDWRGWLGPYLLDVLVEYAHEHGVTVLEAEVLSENRPMRAVAAHRGAVVIDHPDWTITRLALATDGTVPPWPPDDHRPRVLVEARSGRWRGEQALRQAGFSVAVCGGPDARTGLPCPALAGEPCPLAVGATVIVCALPPDDPAATALVAAHRARVPHPSVLTDGDPGADASDGAADSLTACRTSAELVRRIEQAAVKRPR